MVEPASRGGGVSGPGGGVSGPGGVPGRGGGGVPGPGGGVVSQHALRQTPPPVNRMNDRHL